MSDASTNTPSATTATAVAAAASAATAATANAPTPDAPTDDADLEVVMAQCGVSMETACELLNQADGDLVNAIAYHLNPVLRTSAEHAKDKEWNLIAEGDAANDGTQAKLAELRVISASKNAVLEARREQGEV